MKNNYGYKTSDLALATYLSLEGFVFDVEEDELNSQRKCFCFERKNGVKIENKIEEFQRREVRVEPQAYFDQLRTIKARIYSY